MQLLISQAGDPSMVTHAQVIAYTKVAYSLCHEAIRLERTMPVASRLFLGSIAANAQPSSVLPGVRADVLRNMSMKFFGEPLTSVEEASLLDVIQSTVMYADTLTDIDQRLPVAFAGACSVLLGSHIFVAN
jgi:hypothetical protein